MARGKPTFLSICFAEARPCARAIPRSRRSSEAVIERCEACERFERRCGRVLARDAAVHKGCIRAARIVIAVPILLRDAPDEIRGVERGEIGHANHIAGVDLHGNDRARRTRATADDAVRRDKLFELLLGDRLHARRNREIHVVALAGRRFAFHLMHHAIGIGHDHAFAVRARKVAVVYRFDARLADLVAAFVIGACGRVVQNAIGNRSHVAKHLARQGLVRVYAMRALLHIDAGECIGMLGDERHVAASRRRRYLALRLGASRRIFDALAHNGIG